MTDAPAATQQEWRKALPASGDRNMWTDQQANLIEAMGLVHTDDNGNRTLAPRPIVEAFLYTCQRTGLDPLARQVYCIARWDSQAGQLKWTTQTSIDGFRVIAERHGKYAGQGDVEWLTEDGRWVDVFLPGHPGFGQHPLAARATIYRHDFVKPLRAVAEWGAYVQTKRNGDPVRMWAQMGPGQLAKCAEALGLRKAFPQDLSGLYTADEMQQMDSDSSTLALPAAEADRPQQHPAQQPQQAPQQQGVRPVDPAEQTAWWDRLTRIGFLGVKGSGDGGLRDAFQEAKQAGVLSWPIGPDEEQTFREFLIQQSARLPEAAPGPESEEQQLQVDDQGVVQDDDPPMVFAAPPAKPAQQQQVSEPLPPAPAGAPAAAPVVVDETDPDVPVWAHAEQPAAEWTQTPDDEQPM